jgi:DNA-binding transcriptional LysR family regulator
MRLDWTDLRIFLHVCDAGSMTAAAARAHLTLAAVSARMRGLEQSCGIVLFERRARGVVPTAAGEVLAAHARLVFDQVQRLQRDLLQAHGAAPRRTVLLANSSALARPLADALAEAGPASGAPALLVRESASEATVQALRSGAADVGIVSDAVETRGLAAQDLGPDPLVLVVERTHALAARPAVAFRETLAQPWVAWGEQSALSAHLQMRAIALGTPITPRVTYPALQGVLRLVGSGVGVTVLPRAVLPADPAAAGVACIAMEERWAARRLLVCRPEGEDALRAELVERIGRLWRA